MTRRDAIDWQAAYHHFIALGPQRSFVAVAERFGVSDTAVRNRAKRDGWNERAVTIDRAAAAAVEAELAEGHEERLRKNLAVIRKAVDKVDADLEAGRADVAVRDLVGLLKIEQLLTGGVTSRVGVDPVDVQAVFSAFVRVTVPFVELGRRDEYLATLDRETSGLLAALELGARVVDLGEDEVEEVDG